MRVVVFPHDLDMGGSQMNAIEIAAASRDLGVEATIFGRPGALNTRIDELGLEFVEAPRFRFRPTPDVVRALHKTALEREASVIHGYEWPPALESYLASAMLPQTVAVSTVMSMAVAPFIPKSMPLIVGTEQIAANERSAGRARVEVLEPPVDLAHNVHPPAADVDEFRGRHGIAREDFLLVCVTRLARELKAEGLLTAIRVAGTAPSSWRLKLLVVGDGPARAEVQEAAAMANNNANNNVVTLTGQLLDPRPAYASANAVLGMGGSALRGLAFAKPLIVQGEKGYFRLLDENSVQDFLWQGWYGVGSPDSNAEARLSGILKRLIDNPQLLASLGQFGHHLVQNRFSLSSAARRQIQIYESALSELESRSRVAAGALKSVPPFVGYHCQRLLERATKKARVDDFNALPIAASRTRREREQRHLVYMAGVNWDGIPGTDRRLVDQLAKELKVHWVDPPTPFRPRMMFRADCVTATAESKGITRIRTVVPPGISYPVSRDIARQMQRQSIEKSLARSGIEPIATVLAYPGGEFPNVDGLKCLYITDDWIAGAGLMGMSESWVRQNVNCAASKADVVYAVSPTLLDSSEILVPRDTKTGVLPNGCEVLPPPHAERPTGLPSPYAILIGQLNERLDLDALIATAASGLAIVVIGPRLERDRQVSTQLSAFLSHPSVTWLGRQSQEDLRRHLEHAAVGLTPYVDNRFNRGSFPLKTLEYLANGLPVVSTDLPASRWLDSPDIQISSDPSEFASLAVAASHRQDDPEDRRRRRQFAERQTWQHRANDLVSGLT